MTDIMTRRIATYLADSEAAEGLTPIGIDGVEVFHARSDLGLVATVYRPIVCLVLRGSKQMMVGGASHVVHAGQSIVVSMDLPVVARIVDATPDAPYIALSMPIDMGLVRQLEADLGGRPTLPRDRAIEVGETDPAFADCAARLVALLDRPNAVPVLRDAMIREMHYWLLVGPHGDMIRSLAVPDGASERIVRVIGQIGRDFALPLRVERLARTAGMSPSAFHTHFKGITGLSPLQYQKRLRLLEARRLMLSDGVNAATAARTVGYESLSQFSREYARTFGAPPRRDVVALRDAA